MTDRLAPIREFTAADVRNIATLEIDNPRVLSALCQVMNIHVTTEQFSLGKDRWFLCPPAPLGNFVGTYAEAKAYVTGFAAARLAGQRSLEKLAQKIHLVLNSELELSR